MRRDNPFYVAPAGQYQPIGQGLTNLASAFMDTPSAGETAKAEALAWQARAARQEQEFAQQDRQEMDRMANLFELYDPATYDPRQVLATGLRGNMDQGDLAQLFLTASGNLNGMTDEQRTGALVGTGRTLAENTAVSIPHQTRIRNENAANDLMDNASRDSVVAQAFLTGGPEAGSTARDAVYGPNAGQKPVDPWLAAKRQSDVEGAVVGELDNLPKLLGLEDDAVVPQELYAYVVPRAMQRVKQGLSPSAAVQEVLQSAKVGTTNNWFFDDTITYSLPEEVTPPAAGAPSAQTSPGQYPGAPPVGTIEEGYMYNGGDPASASSWSPVNG